MEIFVDLKRNIKKLTLQNGVKYSVLHERSDHKNLLDILKLANFSNKSDLIKFVRNQDGFFRFALWNNNFFFASVDQVASKSILYKKENNNLYVYFDTPNENKFKIFISPQIQMNLDNHNPISITDLRLLRRIVRDKKFRDASATRTLSMWDSVRRGEFKWIYPHQENADYVYNSGLQYELNILKKYALPTLMEIPNDSEYYITANRLIKFLKYFVDIDDEKVPCNSLLREFIGGSCFEE